MVLYKILPYLNIFFNVKENKTMENEMENLVEEDWILYSHPRTATVNQAAFRSFAELVDYRLDKRKLKLGISLNL